MIYPLFKKNVSDSLLLWRNLVITVRNAGIISASSRGGVVWGKILSDPVVAQPSLINNRIHLYSKSGSIRIMDPSSGVILREFNPGSPVDINLSPVSDGTLEYAVLADGRLMCIGPDGEVFWSQYLAGYPSVEPAWNDRILYIPLKSGFVMAVDRYSGMVLFRYDTKRTMDSICVYSRRIIMGDTTGTIYCYSSESDDLLWTKHLKGLGAAWLYRRDDSTVAVYNNGKAYRLSLSGDIIWECQIPSQLSLSPVSDGKSIYLSKEKKLFIMNTLNGNIVPLYSLAEMPSSPMVLTEREIVYMSQHYGIVTLRK